MRNIYFSVIFLIVVCFNEMTPLADNLFAAALHVVVLDSDGNTVSGRLVQCDTKKISLDSSGKIQDFSPEKILLIRSRQDQEQSEAKSKLKTESTTSSDADTKSAAVKKPEMNVQLYDGTRFAATGFTTSGEKAKIICGPDCVREIPLNRIAHVRFIVPGKKPGGFSEIDWESLLKKKSDGDRLIVVSSGSLDDHTGIIRDVSDETIRFELDGEVLSVNRKKIVGITFRQTGAVEQATPFCTFVDTFGSRLALSELRYDPNSDRFTWKLSCGIDGETSGTDWIEIDFAKQNTVSLLQLEPASLVHIPFLLWTENGDQGPMQSLRKFSEAKVRSTQDQPSEPALQLISSEKRQGETTQGKLTQLPIPTLPGIILDRKTYTTGFSLPIKTELVYTLDESYQILRGIAGIDDRIRPQGNVRLIIRGDETILLDEKIRGDQSARKINIPISGFKKLTIIADGAQNGIEAAGRINLVDMLLVK